MWNEFKKFAVRGNMMDLAVGIIIGAAFTTIVNSFVSDIVTPPLGLLIGGFDFEQKMIVLKAGEVAGPYTTPQAAADAGAITLNWGRFVNGLITFFLVAWVMFFVVRGLNRLRELSAKAAKDEADADVPEPSEDILLLREIRDALVKK